MRDYKARDQVSEETKVKTAKGGKPLPKSQVNAKSKRIGKSQSWPRMPKTKLAKLRDYAI